MRSFETLLRLSKHPIFNCLSESAIKGYVNEDICLKMWIVLYTEDPSLETKEVRPLARTAIITEEQMKEIWSILCRLEEIAKRVDKPNVKKRILARLHMSTLAPIVKRSINDQISIEEMTDWLSHFFSGTKRVCERHDGRQFPADERQLRHHAAARLPHQGKTQQERGALPPLAGDHRQPARERPRRRKGGKP